MEKLPTHLNYRPDIDGLRALSIISVLLFHAGITGITGGYIGVDVFFVISGYLITSILLKELRNNGTISIVGFYDRRIRRIFPALTIVLIASFIAGSMLMMAQEFEAYAKSLTTTVVFGSNIFFWREAGYFSGAAIMKPLLHTWSIAVEEQFYILFPLYLLCAFRFCGRHYVGLTIVGLLFSFCLCIWTLSIDKDIATFYLLPTRAWELLIGSVLAFGILPNIKGRMVLNVLSAVGLAMIIYPVFVFTTSTTFPGPNALFPTIGAALLIYAGQSNHTVKPLINRFLSLSPFVFTGKISYSLYLWHWPIFVFVQYYLIRAWTLPEQLLCIVISFILAFISWKYIEQPFRKSGCVYKKKYVFSAALASILILGFVGLYGFMTKGIPNRFSQEVKDLSIVEKGVNTKSYGLEGFQWVNKWLGAENGSSPSFVVWGDSHAGALSPALSDAGSRVGKRGVLLKQAGCLPVANLTEGELSKECREFNKAVLEVLQQDRFKTIIIVGRWSAYPRWLSKTKSQIGTAKSRERFESLISETVALLQGQGKKVYIVSQVPPIKGYNVPSVLGRARQYNKPIDISTSKQTYLDKHAHIHSVWSKLGMNYNISTIYPHQSLCDKDMCKLTHNGKALYYDGDHLSTYGAQHISHSFDKVFISREPQT
jgi:peptidoglycan/LPS O-acetylase OafA/YrhL